MSTAVRASTQAVMSARLGPVGAAGVAGGVGVAESDGDGVADGCDGLGVVGDGEALSVELGEAVGVGVGEAAEVGVEETVALGVGEADVVSAAGVECADPGARSGAQATFSAAIRSLATWSAVFAAAVSVAVGGVDTLDAEVVDDVAGVEDVEDLAVDAVVDDLAAAEVVVVGVPDASWAAVA